MTQYPFRRSYYLLAILLFVFNIQTTVHAQDYQKAWEALGKNDNKTARSLLEKAQKLTSTAADAALTSLLLETFDGHEAEGRVFLDKARKTLPDPYPYYYALWYNEGVAGSYGLKDPNQVKFLEELLEDPKCNEMMKASISYHLSHHYIAKDEAKKARAATATLSNITEWQYTGPFDNISESGFDKAYPPIEQPGPDAKFKATNNSEIWWFKPGYTTLDGWQLVGQYINWNIGIVYAQSFVTAPADMEGVLALGYTASSIKVWVNDQLLFSELEERKTDFDYLRIPVKLKKGNNRILVQLGLSDGETTNFSCRMFDKSGALAQGLVSTDKYAAYPKASGPAPQPLPFFAEAFFEKKIAESPDNLLNYYLLAETYLRSLKSKEALETVEKALTKSPDNVILRFQRLNCLRRLGNRTELTQEMEDIKRLAPEHLVSLIFKYSEEFDNEKYDEAQELLDRWAQLYGVDAQIYEKRIKLLLQREKFQEAIKMIADAYKEYPTEPYFVDMQHDVQLKVNKNPWGAINIYEKFLEKYYYLPLAYALANDLVEQGAGSRAVDIYEKVDKMFPGDPNPSEYLFNYYYNIKETKKAKVWLDKLQSMVPFSGNYWESAAKLAERSEDKKAALANYQKSLHYSPNDYDVRRQIRELQGKPDFATLLPQNDVYDLYKKTKTEGKEGEHDWYYVLDERCAILYPERNSEIYSTLVIKILNQAGIDYWKESSIGYDDSRQRLIIEKAEVLKPNGSKLAAEQNGNQLVFPNLAVGDGLHIRYRLVNYAYGRMAREFWTSYYFNAFVPTDISRYSLFVPPSIPIQFKYLNTDIKPVVKELTSENLKQYTWETKDEKALKDQRMLPPMCDLAKVMHISTLPNWTEVSGWYGDVSAVQAKRDYDVLKLAKELFPAGKTMTETEKAKAIYDWIAKNVRYSSVPFRQSGYVPQRASKVIQTKLGDCKDLATLFAALGREAGLKVNLVLVDTRDQGLHAMELPSMEFNHCIVKVVADGQTWYLELTDPELPFGSLPNSDRKALALEIPFGDNGVASKEPFILDPKNRQQDYRHASTKVEIKGRDLVISSEGIRGGSITSNMRNTYKTLPQTKRVEEMQGTLAKHFTNPVTVKEVRFGNLEEVKDTLHYNVKYSVKNEVAEIGQMTTFKMPFLDVFVNSDAFPEEERTLPLTYWEYEDADHYLEEVTIQLPEGKTFADIPKDVSLSYEEMTYSLKYNKTAPGTLKVTREVRPKREIFAAEDYEKLRTFMEAAIAAETRWVSFK